MAKRKIYKDDGITEDFDKEGQEPDETSADAGNVDALIAQSDEAKGDETKTDEAEAEVSAPAAELPKLGEVHPEAQAAVDLDPVIADVLKDVGNKVTPLFDKFREAEGKLKELEDEAKNRFAHVRQKATELVAALESWFARG